MIRRLSLLAAALAACAPSAPAPLKMRVLVPSPDDPSQFVMSEVELKTLTDLAHLSGKAASTQAGVVVRVDPSQVTSTSASDLRKAMVKDSGSPFKFAYFVDSGVVWPEDWHALNAATTYWNFERAYDYFHQTLNAGDDVPGTLEVDYWADVTIVQGGSAQTQQDNAAFYAPLQQFWIYPFAQLHSIPLSMNPGVVAHEYSHAVLNHQMWGGQPVPAVYGTWTSTRALNVLKSMDEGFADAFGAEVVSDPNFIAPSIPQIGDDRRLDVTRCYSSTQVVLPDGERVPLSTYVDQVTPDTYDPYALGSVVAAAMWAAAGEVDPLKRDLVFQAMLDAEATLGHDVDAQSGVDGSGNGFDLDLIADAIATAATDAKVHDTICSVLLDRWSPVTRPSGSNPTPVPSCGNNIIPESKCP